MNMNTLSSQASDCGSAVRETRRKSIARNLAKLLIVAIGLGVCALPAHAQTYTGAPFETSCQNASGDGPVHAGDSVICTITANVSFPQAAPFTVTPPDGSTVTECATPFSPDRMTAQIGGSTLPVFVTVQSPTGAAHTAIGHGLAGLTVPANTCAFTWLIEPPQTRPPSPPDVIPAGTVIGTETFTVDQTIPCGREITRQEGMEWISNGDFSTFAPDGNPIASTDVGFRAILSGGLLQCGNSASKRSPVNTGMPAQTSCTYAVDPAHSAITATCTVTNNLFLPTGGTLILSPLTPSGAHVTGCTSSTPGIVVNSEGATLPTATYTLLPFMPFGGTPFTFQVQIGNSTTVPVNSCAFTSLGAENPAGIPGNVVVGTQTLSLPLQCGPELTQSATSYVPNGTSVMWPPEFGGFATYFPETTHARISGGFICGNGDPTTLSKFTSTSLPVEFSCSTATGATTDCTITNNVLQYTGDVVFVSPTSPSNATVTSCASNAPGVLATGPGGILPVFVQALGIIVTPPFFSPDGHSAGPIQAAALDSSGNPITIVPPNTCAYTYVGQTPFGLEAGRVMGTETVTIQQGSGNTTELVQRANMYENVGIAFGFNCSGLVTALANPALCVPPTSNIIAPFLFPLFDNAGNLVLGTAGVPQESMQDVYSGSSGTPIHFH
jgi:hypothetical protein